MLLTLKEFCQAEKITQMMSSGLSQFEPELERSGHLQKHV